MLAPYRTPIAIALFEIDPLRSSKRCKVGRSHRMSVISLRGTTAERRAVPCWHAGVARELTSRHLRSFGCSAKHTHLVRFVQERSSRSLRVPPSYSDAPPPCGGCPLSTGRHRGGDRRPSEPPPPLNQVGVGSLQPHLVAMNESPASRSRLGGRGRVEPARCLRRRRR